LVDTRVARGGHTPIQFCRIETGQDLLAN